VLTLTLTGLAADRAPAGGPGSKPGRRLGRRHARRRCNRHSRPPMVSDRGHRHRRRPRRGCRVGTHNVRLRVATTATDHIGLSVSDHPRRDHKRSIGPVQTASYLRWADQRIRTGRVASRVCEPTRPRRHLAARPAVHRPSGTAPSRRPVLRERRPRRSSRAEVPQGPEHPPNRT
jgi:hypothetical protein